LGPLGKDGSNPLILDGRPESWPLFKKALHQLLVRLTRSIYGLRGANKAFMKQLGSEIEGFSEKVEYKDVNGKLKVELMISFAALRIWNCESDFLIICGRRGG
jgi:hypothetical protein